MLGKNIYKKWLKLDEKEKAEEYVKQINRKCKKIKNKYVFDYENFIKNPNKEINNICKFLNDNKVLTILVPQ